MAGPLWVAACLYPLGGHSPCVEHFTPLALVIQHKVLKSIYMVIWQTRKINYIDSFTLEVVL